MALGYSYYRKKWIHLCILTVGLGAFLWAYAKGEAKADPGVVPLVVALAIIGHGGLIVQMLRAKKAEERAKQAVLAAISKGEGVDRGQ